MKPFVYVCLHLHQFAVQTAMRLRVELHGNPVVVLSGEPPVEQVCSLNSLAARKGIRTGMTRTEMESIDGVEILRHSLMEEQAAKQVLLEAAGLFTPRMEELESATAFSLMLDMTGSSLVFGTVSEIVDKIRKAVVQLGFSVQIGVSSNFLASFCVVRSTTRQITIVPHGEEAAMLAKLPLSALSLTEQHEATFALWGIRTLQELAMLPEEEVVVRLGQEGKRLRLLARGEHPHLMVPIEPAFVLDEFIEFDAPVEMLDSLLFVLGPMLEQVVMRAVNRALALSCITVKLGLDGGGEHERTIKPALPMTDKKLLLKLLHLDLQMHPPSAGVISLRLSAEPGKQSKVQLGLFSPQLPEPTRLEVTLARIAMLVGENRVGRAQLIDSHAAEAFRVEKFTILPPSRKEPTPALPSLALRRLRPARPIRVHLTGKQIRLLHMLGKRYEVTAAYGPWRKSGQWWSPQLWSYEEWDIAASCNGEPPLLALVSHDLLRGAWRIEALYD